MRRRHRRAYTVAAIVALGAIGAALAYVLVTKYQGRDIKGSPKVEFTPTLVTPTTLPPAQPPATPKKPAARPEGIVWPTWGYDAARLRTVSGTGHKPPYRALWAFGAGSLVEYPPAIAFGRLFFSTNHGSMIALNAATGRQAWRVESGRCVAASPAVDDGLVIQSFLNRPPCNSTRSDIDGEVVAFQAGYGKVRWRTTTGPTESSPLVAGGRVYVGDWRGNVYALDEQTGSIVWTAHVGGKVKGAVSLADATLYVGSYDGHVYALDPTTGAIRWSASGQPTLGSAGTFYSTPAVAYGRVYIGSTDGKVYSIGALSGDLRWSYGTGGYVYGSPAIWNQLVLIGSYSGTFYAFDAATGAVRWSFQAGGPISGSGTVIDGVVYFATLKEKTYALDAATGKELWSWNDGKYTPAVADRHRLYLVGYTKLYAMIPR